MLSEIKNSDNPNFLIISKFSSLDVNCRHIKLNNNEQDIKHNKQETDDLKENYLLTKQKVGMITTVLGLAGGIIVSITKSFFGI